jgi:kinesin family protein 6/9
MHLLVLLQTGAGKTFTMAGDIRHYTHRGVIPRAIHQIFKEVDMRVDKLYTVQVSYLEVGG